MNNSKDDNVDEIDENGFYLEIFVKIFVKILVKLFF